MRKLLILALLLCKCLALIDIKVDLSQHNDAKAQNYITDDIVTLATRSGNFDYDDIDGIKRHSFFDERRNWRKKALLKHSEFEHKNWDDKRRHDYNTARYLDEHEAKLFSNIDGLRDLDFTSNFRGQKHYDEPDKGTMFKSSEIHSSAYLKKDTDKKNIISSINCERPHEKYENCFAGCAAITCDNPRDRLRPCYPFCEAGCICVSPYIRDDRTHKCVLPDDCSRGLKGIPDLGDET